MRKGPHAAEIPKLSKRKSNRACVQPRSTVTTQPLQRGHGEHASHAIHGRGNPQTFQHPTPHHHPRRHPRRGVIGERFHDNNGEVVGTQGFYIDVAPTAQDRASSITAAVAEIADNRAAIEQAKGVLMDVYRIDAEAAFELLRWRSQESNVKLRVLAEQLLVDVRTLARDEDSLPSRATLTGCC
jgi:ANTAR domain